MPIDSNSNNQVTKNFENSYKIQNTFKICNKMLGLTFIEIVITILLLSTLLSNLLFTFTSSTRSLQINIEDYIAQMAALEIIEQLCSIPYKLIPVGNFSNNQIKDKLPIDLNLSSGLCFHVSDIPNLEREVEIKEINKPNKKPVKIIEVRIKILNSKVKTTTYANSNIKTVKLKAIVAEE